MEKIVHQTQNGEVLEISNLEPNEENDALCKVFLQQLRSNHVVRVLKLIFSPFFGSAESCQALGEFVKSSKTLESLRMFSVGMDGDGLSYIIRGLLENPNSALSGLDIGCNIKLGKTGAEVVEELLLRNIPTLTSLDICAPRWTSEETAPVARALAKNTTLRQLACGGEGGITHPDREGPLSCFLRALTPVENLTSEQAAYQDGTHNQTLQVLHIDNVFEKGVAENLIQMLTHNKCLKILRLWNFHFNREQWGEVWKALKHNHVMVGIYLPLCESGLGESFGDLMELLQANRTLKKIDLVGTPLEESGQSALVKEQLERNARLADYLGTLRNKLKFVPPKIGRLFLCGYPRAGKTTLRRSMVGTQGNVIHRMMFKATAWMANQSCIFQSYFDRRTQGIEIRVLRDSGDKHITVWDLAGQEEYHALHDNHYMFPDINQACVFLFLYKPIFNAEGQWEDEASAKCLEKQLSYWLGFITSNCSKTGWILPKVTIVLTHLDKLAPRFGKHESTRAERYIQWAEIEGKMDQVREFFKGHVDLNTNVHAVNAVSVQHAHKVVNDVFACFDDLFKNTLPKVPAACEEMNLFLAKWTAKKTNRFYPIIEHAKFLKLCMENKELDALFQDVPSELAQEALEIRKEYHEKNELAVASYLHDVGSIIHFPKSSFVVVDPNWLGKVFLGQLFKPGDETYKPIIQNTRNGCVSHADLQAVLEDFIQNKGYRGFTTGDLIRLMKELEICYEKVTPNTDPPVRSYFIPSTLDDPQNLAQQGRRVLKWEKVQNRSNPNYRGLRLQCMDQSRTFLSPGFFQRFQVNLQKYLRNQMFLQYKIEKNLIVLQHDGQEILVEKSGDDGLQDGDYVDILVKSFSPAGGGKDQNLVTDVVKQVREFCASREGCPGVALEEAILRPRCVELLSLCWHRRKQAVLKTDLTKAVMKKLFKSNRLELWDDNSYVNSIRDKSHIYWYRFHAAPEDKDLGAEDVEAMDMLSVLDITEAILKYRAGLSEQRYAIFQAIDEVQSVAGADIPSTSQTTLQTEAEVARVHSDIPITNQSQSPPDGESMWLSRFQDEQDRRMKEGLSMLGDVVRDAESNIISRIDEQTTILRHIDASMGEMQILQQKLYSTLMEKLDEVMGSIAQVHDIPGLPHFSHQNVGLKQWLAAVIQIGKPLKLHFMCESPNQPHYVENQKGLELINLLPGEAYKTLRPLILGSIKILFILVKAGLHVAAGIGNAVPNYTDIPGVEPLLVTSLTGETIMESMKGISKSNPIDSTLAEAWGTVQSLMAPVKARGQIPEVFQLYRVQYKSRMLSTYLSKRSSFWLCEKCRNEADGANLLLL
ncbi:unnamed protein product [Calypogeia fissa]